MSSSYGNNPFYQSLLGTSQVDNVNSAQVNTRSLTVSSLTSGLVSATSGGTLQNAIVGSGLSFSGNTLNNTGLTSITSGATGPVYISTSSTGSVQIALPQNLGPTSDVTFNSLTSESFIQLNSLIGADGLMISGSGSLATLSELRAPLIYNPGTYSLRVALAGSTGIDYTVRGNTGYITNKNITGTTGPIGSIGWTGPIGPIGPTGYTGPQGPSVSANSSSVGELNITSASSALALTLQNTFYKITGWTVGTFNSGTTPSSTNSNIVINSSGIYQTLANISYIPGGNAHTFVFAVFVNGTQISGHQTSNMVNSTNNVINNVTLTGVVQFNGGDIVDIRVQNITSASTTITVQNANFNLCVQGGSQGPTGYTGPVYTAGTNISFAGSTISTITNPTFERILNSSLGSTNLLLGTSSGARLTTGGGNLLVGNSSGNAITTGTFNIGLGPGTYGGSGTMTQSNAYNIAVGVNSLFSATSTANNNIGVGFSALQTLTNGVNNCCVGNQSGQAIIGAINNTFEGSFSGFSVSSGQANTLIGYSAGYIISTGSNNSGLGYNTLQGLTTGSSNLHLGYNTQSSSSSVSNEIVIGSNNTTTVGRGTNTAFINAPLGLYSYSPGYWWGYAGSVTSGIISWTAFSPSRNIALKPTDATQLILPFLGEYELTISGGVYIGAINQGISMYLNGGLYLSQPIYFNTITGWTNASLTTLVNCVSANSYVQYTATASLGISSSVPLIFTAKFISL